MFQVPELDYDYAALAPAISEEIMRLHHQRHHQGYVDKLNVTLEGVEASSDIARLLGKLDELPETIRRTVRNNGGGHYNHSLFWRVMSPDGGGQPGGELAERIEAKFGGYAQFVEQFTTEALGIFGSGWAWLMPDLAIVTTPNQDNPLMSGGAEPILGLDVWEHAYYLDYTNVRAEYVKAWWNVVNWAEVEKRYASAIIS